MAGQTSINLKEQKETVLKLWEKRALDEVPSASGAPSLVLRNSLPIYLEHLSDALATNRKMDVKSVLIHDRESIRIGRLHGEDRAGTASYVLTEVIFEYHILREIIFQILEVDGQLNPSQRDIILDSIEQAVNDAAVTFSEVHADIQQKFVSTLTHDLKTPITSAKMAAQLILRRSDKPDDCIRSAGRIIGGLNRLNSMIHDLLDVSRIRAGEPLAMQFVACDFTAVVRDVVDEMNDVHGGRVQFECGNVVEAHLGCDGLRRAVENLIENAIKYGARETMVSVYLEYTETSLQLTVHNEGGPIPEGELPLLFQQYRRSKSASESTHTGWGLGLTLVQGVIDAHRGKKFESRARKEWERPSL